MKLKILCQTFLSLSFFCACAAQAQEFSTAPNDIFEDKAVNQFMQENKIPAVAVELYINGKPRQFAFGYANPEKKDFVSQYTIFELGSLTKLFTSLMLAEQVNAGHMKLSDSVSNYLGDLSSVKNLDPITLQMLATHTSGLPFEIPKNAKTPEQLKTYLMQWHPEKPIGTVYQYSNLGMGLLGEALAGEAHQDFDPLYRKEVTAPLGMSPVDITIPVEYESVIAQGYDKTGAPVPGTNPGILPTAFALKAEANDMMIFLRAAIGFKNVPKKIFAAMRMTQTPYVQLADRQQGLGWEIHPLDSNSDKTLMQVPDNLLVARDAKPLDASQHVFNPHALIDKTGTTDGFRAYIAVIPDRQSGIVILANKSVPGTAIVKLGRTILLSLTKDTASQKSPIRE